MLDTSFSLPAIGRDWLGAEVLRWQVRYRLGVALAGALAAVGAVLAAGSGVQWGEAAVAAAASGAYALISALGAHRAAHRRHAGRRLRAAVAVSDVAFVFAVTVALAGVHHLERALVLTAFSVLVTQLYLGTYAARMAFRVGTVAYAGLLVWAGARVPGVDVWGGMVDFALFGIGGLVVAAVHASRQRRLRDLVGLFGRLEEGDFGHAYDWTRDPRPDAVSAVGRAYDRMRTQVATAVLTDPLSGCVNRRGYDQELTRALARAERASAPVGLLAVDIDHFKRVNDDFGHAAGDAVIRGVGGLLRELVRAGDVVARTGGEEFVVILPGADEAGACSLARRMVDAVRGHRFEVVPGHTVTVSAGVASELVRDAEVAEALRARADEALYAAKRGGRDRAVTWTTAGPRRVDTPAFGGRAVSWAPERDSGTLPGFAAVVRSSGRG